MARTMSTDTTSVYRFKLTTTAVVTKWGSADEKEETTTVRYVGYYHNRYQLDPWVPTNGYFKVEHQKLVITQNLRGQCILGWETIATKEYRDGEKI